MSVAFHRLNTCTLAALGLTLVVGLTASAQFGEPEQVDFEVRQAVRQMRSDLQYVRSYGGRAVISSGVVDSNERDALSAVLDFRVGISESAVGVVYHPVRLPRGRVRGLPLLHIDEPQTRLFDQDGGVLIRARARQPIRLDSDFHLDRWASNEHFISSPQLISEVLATWGTDPALARPITSLGYPHWDDTSTADDRFMACDPWMDRSRTPPHVHFANCGRRIRFAARYDYRPDLILVTTRRGDAVWECWRITWVKAALGARQLWFPLSIRREVFNIVEAQSHGIVPRAMWTVETRIDPTSLATVVPFSLQVPRLPPGTQRKVVTDHQKQMSAEQMATRYNRLLDLSRDAGARVGEESSVTVATTDNGRLSSSSVVMIIAGIVLASLLCVRWMLKKDRSAVA